MEENNYSKAKKNYWASKTPEQRSDMARHAATSKWANMTPEKKREHAMKMCAGRNKQREEYRKMMED